MKQPCLTLAKFCTCDLSSAFILTLFMCVAAGHAQSQGVATLKGFIRDAHGTLVEHAKVHLQKRGVPEEKVSESDLKGEYRYESLEAGEYTIRAEKGGLPSATFGPFTLREGQNTRIDLQFQEFQAKSTIADGPQFFEQPQFTVAGVTDATSHGGHGSDAVSRTTQSLTHELSGLNSKGPGPHPTESEAALRTTLQNNT
jgi:hypothetical protein